MALTKTQVSGLYVAIFDRASEGEGNTYWQTNYDDMATAANDMLNTPDAQEYFGGDLSDQEFIETIYLNTLNKTATDDPDGIAYWVKELANGKSRGEVVATLINAIYDYADSTDPKTKAAYEQFVNRVEVSDYTADTIQEAPENYKEVLGFESPSNPDGQLVVADDEATVEVAEAAIDAIVNKGIEYQMTPDVDSPLLTDKDDTITATLADLGVADVLADPSTTDHDVLNIDTTIGNLPTFAAVNIETINVNFDMAGNGTVNAVDFSGANIVVSSDRTGYNGVATVTNLYDNKATAGDSITTLNVNGIKGGIVDAGQAGTVNLTSLSGVEDYNLIVNGNVVVAGVPTTGKLNIDATKDSTVDISTAPAGFIRGATISGDSDVTIRTTADELSTERVANNGTGEITLQLTNLPTIDNAGSATSDVDMRNMDVENVVSEVAWTREIVFSDTLNFTATQTGNAGAEFNSPFTFAPGQTPAGSLTVNLTQAADGTDSILINTIGGGVDGIASSTINAQKGGTIAAITNANGAAISATNTIIAGDDLIVNAATMTGQVLEMSGDSKGDAVINNLDVASVVATNFANDLVLNEAAGANLNNLSVLGAQGKNSITTTTTTGNVNITTQDSDDTINANSVTTGRLNVTTNDGDDTVTATGMTTSQATIDTGAGDDNVTVQNAANGVATIVTGDGNDTVTINNATAGTVNVNAGAGNDIINISNTTPNIQTLTISGGEGDDIVDVASGSDFTTSTINLNNDIDNLRIDTVATFTNTQLDEKTFDVTSGTAAIDQLNVTFDATAFDNTHTISYETDLSQMNFSASSATEVEYVNINATASQGDDVILAAHNATNVIDITTASADEDVIQIFADSAGTTINNLQSGATQPDVLTADLTGIVQANVDFDVAVISGFETANDSLILGEAATATNYTEISVDAYIGGAQGANPTTTGIEDYLATAIVAANAQMAGSAALDYVYVYDNDNDGNGAGKDAWLLWDSDNDHTVDSAILLVGVEPNTPDGTGFAASDIIAAS